MNVTEIKPIDIILPLKVEKYYDKDNKKKTENPFSLQDDEKIDILYFIENSWQSLNHFLMTIPSKTFALPYLTIPNYNSQWQINISDNP